MIRTDKDGMRGNLSILHNVTKNIWEYIPTNSNLINDTLSVYKKILPNIDQAENIRSAYSIP